MNFSISVIFLDKTPNVISALCHDSPAVRLSSFVYHKVSRSYISRTVWPRITQFYTNIQTNPVYSHVQMLHFLVVSIWPMSCKILSSWMMSARSLLNSGIRSFNWASLSLLVKWAMKVTIPVARRWTLSMASLSVLKWGDSMQFTDAYSRWWRTRLL